MIEGFIDPGPYMRLYTYESKGDKVYVELFDTNKKSVKKFDMPLANFDNVNDRNMSMEWLWEVDAKGNVPDKWAKKPLIVHRGLVKVDDTPKSVVPMPKPTAPIGCKTKKQPVQAVKKASEGFVQDTFAF